MTLSALTIVFLADQAWLMADAITRTLVRLFITRRNLLEWVPAAQATKKPRLDLLGFYRRMAGGIFSNAAKIYARPRTLSVGEKIDEAELTAELRRAGYSEGSDSPIGRYHLGPDGLHVTPGPQSFHGADSAAVIRFERGKVSSISAAGGNTVSVPATH